MIERQVLTPYDLEQRFGLIGGNIFQGEMSLDQLFSFRPTTELSGYKTPVDGLYLCGSGTHPGGGVMGIPGFNASKVVVADHKSKDRKKKLGSVSPRIRAAEQLYLIVEGPPSELVGGAKDPRTRRFLEAVLLGRVSNLPQQRHYFLFPTFFFFLFLARPLFFCGCAGLWFWRTFPLAAPFFVAGEVFFSVSGRGSSWISSGFLCGRT